MGIQDYREKRKEFKNACEKAKKILAVSHMGPDFDSICSLTALAIYLENRWGISPENITIFCEAANTKYFKDKYLFLPQAYNIVPHIGDVSQYDTIIILDCGSLSRINKKIIKEIKDDQYIINIDHHLKNKMFGDLNICNTEVSSTCELLYYLMNRRFLDEDIATCLYAGIVGDTGSFKHKTPPATHLVAADLVGLIDSEWIRSCMAYKTDETDNYVKGIICCRAKYYKGSLAYVCWTPSDRKKFFDMDRNPEQVKSAVHTCLNTVRTVKMTAEIHVLQEDPDNPKNNVFKISLRSNWDSGINVSTLAEKFGGGGHSGAAGADEIKGITLGELKEELFNFIDNL